MRSLALDNIGMLVTCEGTLGEGAFGEGALGEGALGKAALGEGALGIVRDAALVIEDGRVAALTRAGGADTDARVDLERRCVIPGFVDSHTHLVFAGERGEEFAARMAGASYAAGGILTTVSATGAASDVELRALALARRREGLRAGITHVEVKSGYCLTVRGEARLCALAAELTDDATFMGAHVVPSAYAARPDDYVALVCGGMLDACREHVRWIDVFCEHGAFDVDQSRAVLCAGRDAGLGLRIHAAQLRPGGGGVQLGVELDAASVDHCTFLTDDDIDALAGSRTVATFLPVTDFATRQPYPDARRVIDAGATVALATNTNPGSSYTTSMSFCIALAVRDLRMTLPEALLAATTGGARALRREDMGRLAPGCRADVAVLDAPSPAHLAYRPGVPLVAATLVGGSVEFVDPALIDPARLRAVEKRRDEDQTSRDEDQT
ncbi:MAG: imidazolonepropionase [Solirubrobacteraceae bacterium]